MNATELVAQSSTFELTAMWVVAIATILLAVAGVFQDWIRAIVLRPKLDASIALKPPDCHKTKLTYSEEEPGAPCYMLRLSISNYGNHRAENVEVYASELQKKDADGTFQRHGRFSPMHLLWSNVRKPVLPAILAKMSRHCDLGMVIKPEERPKFPEHNDTEVAMKNTTISLSLETTPNMKGHILPPGAYRLKLQIGAANCKVVEKTLEIALEGTWYDEEKEMFDKGLGIRFL